MCLSPPDMECTDPAFFPWGGVGGWVRSDILVCQGVRGILSIFLYVNLNFQGGPSGQWYAFCHCRFDTQLSISFEIRYHLYVLIRNQWYFFHYSRSTCSFLKMILKIMHVLHLTWIYTKYFNWMISPNLWHPV